MKKQKHILLIISGSIAAIKSPEIISQLKARGFNVTCVVSSVGEKFVSSQALASLSGNKTYTHLFSAEEGEMDHIRLSRQADLLVVAPASANILAKMAHGLCDDLATTLLLATDKPVMVAPAMNVKMWEHPATQRNVKYIQDDGIRMIAPRKGELACGEEGMGRMAEPHEIVAAIEGFFEGMPEGKPLEGRKILVTSGPTVEAIDPVRYIANRSSGKQGYAIAEVLASFGADVTLISGPTKLTQPQNVRFIQVESAREMLDSCIKMLPADVAICAAAVADWRAAEVSDQKIKKVQEGDDQVFTFMENPDILECISKHDEKRPQLVVGFAAETENIVQHARQKMQKKGCDWILANDVSHGKVFGQDATAITFIDGKREMVWGAQAKKKVAFKLAAEIADYFVRSGVVKLKHKKKG